MKIKSLNIKYFKSIVGITIHEPNPFTVFVGPNGSGKSNIFEALEFVYLFNDGTLDIFGEKKDLLNRKFENEEIYCNLIFEISNQESFIFSSFTNNNNRFKDSSIHPSPFFESSDDRKLNFNRAEQFFKEYNNFSRIFIRKFENEKVKNVGETKLGYSGENLEKVLKRLLANQNKRNEIEDWLALFIPEFEKIEVQKSQFSSNEDLLIYQKHYDRPFNKKLISDGTFNIIALLTAVYQSDEPQFLCIEEPENGLHPKVIKQLVNFFRSACSEKGHYIWLNTHSQTLASQLTPEEIILVDKIEGETKIKQVKGFNTHGLEMDEAWLSNALGGGLPW